MIKAAFGQTAGAAGVQTHSMFAFHIIEDLNHFALTAKRK